MANALRIAAVARLIQIILFYVPFTLGFGGVFSLIITFVFIIVNILWIRGFVLIGIHLKNRLLFVSSFLFIIGVFIFIGLNLIRLRGEPSDFVISVIAIVILFRGIVNVVFGMGIFRLRGEFGEIAQTYGVLLIIEGAAIASTFLARLNFILEPAVGIAGAMMLFRAADRFASEE